MTPRELDVFWLVGDRLHNREIAESLRLSERTVESHVSSLLRKLGGSNRLALVDAATRFRARRGPGSALPRALSSFVGRSQETDDLLRLVHVHRLLTLTGPAGVGKTRLALHVAHSVTTLPPAILVDLASVPPGDSVERAFADALGVSGDERRLPALIRQVLAGDRHWLVVDNCEHVSATAAALLADLLATTDHLRVLATSHGPLRVAGEVVYEIAPLALSEKPDDPAAVLGAACGRLFADRAAAVSPGFEVTADNARHVAMICRRLDGLPLAIELAAARVRFFSPAELLARLDDRFALLTDGAHGAPSRHRTLEEALRWSYDLLGDGERLLFERCSVFPGEFDYDTAAEVLVHPPLGSADLLRLFPRLLDRSLISRRRRGQATEYRLLDSVRQFAHGRLESRGAADASHERHARHHLRHGAALLTDLRGRDQAGALRWFERHWADLRTAMRWALQQPETTPAWQFLAGVGTGWQILGTRGELFDWIDRLLQRPLPAGDLGIQAAVTSALLLCYQDTGRALTFAEQAHERAEHGGEREQALALLALGWATMSGEQRAPAITHLERAASHFERLHDDWHHAIALFGLAHATSDTEFAQTLLSRAADLFARLHDHVDRASCLTQMAIRAIEGRTRLDEAGSWLTEAARLARLSGNDHERLHAEVSLADLDQHRGDHTSAEARFGGLFAEFRRIGDHRCMVRCLLGLGRAAAFGGDHGQARRHLAEGVELAVGVGDLRATLTGLYLLAESDHATGCFRRAANLLGAARRLDPEGRGNPVPDDQALRTALRDRLGPVGFASAFAAGHRIPLTTLLSR
ncbi:AAA family ATPase [Planomonospora sp. ID67723]|uniref:ATP-binding protein n=1 Tax=Planomonospora sp. ID67723 TaxID=2738134 RepID=UPI0018C3A3DE|nr:LuxR C-terminal-related transcriptional regulator [Planomonospora sp. ID67723]MBG0830093.1 AAA family ATPase [Planomonospora sp. ID67723]